MERVTAEIESKLILRDSSETRWKMTHGSLGRHLLVTVQGALGGWHVHVLHLLQFDSRLDKHRTITPHTSV